MTTLISADERSEERGSAAGAGRVRLPKALRWFWVGSVAAFALSLVVSYLEFRAGMNRYRWLGFDAPFYDLMDNAGTLKLLHSAAFFDPPNAKPVSYPPFGTVQVALLQASGRPVTVFLLIALTAIGFAIWRVRQWLIGYGIGRAEATVFPVTLALVSFPVERLVVQGNVEIFLWIFAAAGVWAYLRGSDDAAAVLWGLAAASKLYPAALLILLLPRRRFRALGVGLLVFAGVSVLSAAYIGPDLSVAWHGSLRDVFGYQQVRAMEMSPRELHANHSFFVMVKLWAAVFDGSALRVVNLYYIVGALAFLGVFWVRLRRMPVANQLLAVSVFMLTLPTISYFHTLVNLYAPLLVMFGIALRAERAGAKVEGLMATSLLFIPLFASFQLFTFTTVFLYCGVVQVILLAALMLCTLQYRFAEHSGERWAISQANNI